MKRLSRECVFCGDDPRNCRNLLPITQLEIEARDAGFCAAVVQPAIQLGEVSAIVKLSNALISEIKKRKELERVPGAAPVYRKVSISQSLVNRLTLKMFDHCVNEVEFPPQLQNLIHIGLGQPPRWEDANSQTVLIPRIRRHEETLDGPTKAALLLAKNPNASNREVAKEIGVDHTTISRWRRQPDFQKKVDLFGSIKNIDKLNLFCYSGSGCLNTRKSPRQRAFSRTPTIIESRLCSIGS